MSDLSISAAIEAIYNSLRDDNRDLDQHIVALKTAMAREGQRDAQFDPARLAQNNRRGRKLMQAYFRQRGVTVSFAGD